MFGDVRLSGRRLPPRRISSVFGDVRIDLRGLRTDAPEVELDLSSVFGNRRVDLAAVPRLAGTPRVTVRARSVFGDLRLRSLTPGASASRWRAVVDRLDRRGGASPPGSPG